MTRLVGPHRRNGSLSSYVYGVSSLYDLPDLPDSILKAASDQTSLQRRLKPIPPQVARYIYRNVRPNPWYHQLTLAAAIMSSSNYDEGTNYAYLSVLHSRLHRLFGTHSNSLHLSSMEDFSNKIEDVMRLYLQGAVCNDSSSGRIAFFQRYQAVAKLSLRWQKRLKPEERDQFRTLLLRPAAHHIDEYTRYIARDTEEERMQRRKEDTDALMPVYANLRSEAHLRWNWFNRFREAYREALQKRKLQRAPKDPWNYTYTDNKWRVQLRIWTPHSLNMELEKIGKSQLQFRSDDDDDLLEIVSITEISSNMELDILENLWFMEVVVFASRDKSSNQNSKSRSWMKAWNYSPASFVGGRGLIYGKSRRLYRKVYEELNILLTPVDEIYYALTFGLMGLDIFTTTGARILEVLQVSFSKDCLVRLIQPPPPGAKDRSPTIRYTLRLRPKGERRAVRHDFFIGQETKRLLARTARVLVDHYKIPDGNTLPIVAFCPGHRRSQRFKPEPYLFQLNGKHLYPSEISSCIRLLLHGVPLRTLSGRAVKLRAHLLRHGFATHAVQVEKIPKDIVGAWLHQKDVAVTGYYSRPTSSMVADAADHYLSRIANNIDVKEAVARSPDDLKKLYDDAISKTGTLAQVVGGHCTSHGFCKAQFACIGCAAKVPDPSKRDQVEHRIEWADKEIAWHQNEGMYPEARRLEQMKRAARVELHEMDLIEQYNADELTDPTLETFDADQEPTLVGDDPPEKA